MEESRIIKKRYLLFSFILLALPSLLLIIPDNSTSSELKPELLLKELNDETRFVSTDFVAEKIINGDRHIILIDVRSPEEYNKFKLKNAINIPLSNLLDKDENGDLLWEGILNHEVNTNIFYSNGSVYANQAWMLARRLNFKNNYVMEGGLNKWVETIMHPVKPSGEASEQAFALYSFRKAAAMYFGNGDAGNAVSSDNKEPQSIVPIVKKNKKGNAGGGC